MDMKYDWRGALAFLSTASVISGCATIMTGTTQPVLMEIVNAPGAKCTGIDKQERKYYPFLALIKLFIPTPIRLFIPIPQ
jgi:hypothetical protein